MCIMKEVVFPLHIVVVWGRVVRNRGYKYIIKSDENGFWMLCVNPTWINELLRERGIEPRIFRSLSWEDIAVNIEDEKIRDLFYILRPTNFWNMCDVVALSMSTYNVEDEDVFWQNWFIKYPMFTLEDVYEILTDEGVCREDALRVTEVIRKGGKTEQSISLREFVELYDVPERLCGAVCKCGRLVSREKAIEAFLDILVCCIDKAELTDEMSDTNTKPSV